MTKNKYINIVIYSILILFFLTIVQRYYNNKLRLKDDKIAILSIENQKQEDSMLSFGFTLKSY